MKSHASGLQFVTYRVQEGIFPPVHNLASSLFFLPLKLQRLVRAGQRIQSRVGQCSDVVQTLFCGVWLMCFFSQAAGQAEHYFQGLERNFPLSETGRDLVTLLPLIVLLEL